MQTVPRVLPRSFMRRIPYRRVVGLLTYLCRTSRPDIAHSVRLAAQYSENPGAKHWRAVIMILRYLSGTRDYALCSTGNNSSHHLQPPLQTPISTCTNSQSTLCIVASIFSVSAFCDASWANCPDTRRSTTGWLLRLENCWIDWCSEKQDTVALSSCEAEYMALTAATKAVLWARNMLAELAMLGGPATGASFPHPLIPRPQQQSHFNPSIHLHHLRRQQSAIAMATNDVFHKRSKHIDTRHHFIRDEVARKPSPYNGLHLANKLQMSSPKHSHHAFSSISATNSFSRSRSLDPFNTRRQ